MHVPKKRHKLYAMHYRLGSGQPRRVGLCSG
jgi:hypothetical protein